MISTDELLASTARVVMGYVSGNHIPASELPSLITAVAKALQNPGGSGAAAAPEVRQKPAVPIKRSVTPAALYCLECGQTLRMLKRHLKDHDLTPDEYKAKWGLPEDYPLVAPLYSQARSDLAKQLGLGHGRRRSSSGGEEAATE